MLTEHTSNRYYKRDVNLTYYDKYKIVVDTMYVIKNDKVDTMTLSDEVIGNIILKDCSPVKLTITYTNKKVPYIKHTTNNIVCDFDLGGGEYYGY